MDQECIICLSDISYTNEFYYTKCCNKPIHNICMYNWIYNNNINYNIQQCIYCRRINEEVILEIPDNIISTPIIVTNNEEECCKYCKKKCIFLVNCLIFIATLTIIILYL
jgi:hypothetical protein